MVGVLVLPRRASAFQIGTTFSDFCHETITFKAILAVEGLTGFMEDVMVANEVEPDATWLKMAEHLEKEMGLDLVNNKQRALLITLFIGVRYPDQGGFTLWDIMSVRELHLSDETQEAHFLRSSYHDGQEGDIAAIAAGRGRIKKMIEASYEAKQRTPFKAQTEKVGFWVEYYGSVPVGVWMPLFYLGQALHTLQDSFTHCYRSPDGMRIYAVGNYLEGITDEHDEQRDGPKHSDYLDQCANEDVTPLVNQAIQASSELYLAVIEYWFTGDNSKVELVLDRWLSYGAEDGTLCTIDHDPPYCDTPWAEMAKRLETTGLLCAATPMTRRGPPGLGTLLCVLILVHTLWRRRLSTTGT
jgi:hypothetical protein